MADTPIPTLYQWAGGETALEALTRVFYDQVHRDDLLAPVFRHMDAHHPHYVAQFLGEVLGGPANYSAERGGHPHMITQHLGKHLNESQRQRWMMLLLKAADEVGLPSDPEFRSAFVAYIEWGTRLAVINSQPGVAAEINAPMPKWGWGTPGGPYQPPE
jgi:hemoglobin